MPAEFSWRRPSEDDLPAALTIQPVLDGSGLVGPEVAHRLWRGLLRHPACYAALVTQAASGRTVGFGAACFVSVEFYEREIGQPRSGVNDRLFAALEAGEPVLCSRSQIAEGNARDGVIQLQLCGNSPDDLSPGDAMAVGSVLANSLVALNRGYRLRASFGAMTVESQRQFARSSGCHVTEFDDGTAMYQVTRDALVTHPGGIGSVLFHYVAPSLRLAPSHQDLLLAALEGGTDEELAATLGLSVPAVKARWRSIFERVGETWVEWATRPEQQARGPQRRHVLLAYCRDHPEELRPYAWSAPTHGPKG